MILLITLVLLFLLLSFLDYWLTQKIIDSGGRELNPILNFIGLIPGKIISAVMVGVAYILIPFIYVFVVADILMLIPCVWNFIRWRKVKAQWDN